MLNEIKIIGENGSEICIHNFKINSGTFWGNIFLKSDWFEANIEFVSSLERLIEFSVGLEKLLNNNGEIDFINEDGNVDFKISVEEPTGKVKISGILIKDMMDEARIEFFLESNCQSLFDFQNGLKNILSQ